MEKEALDAFYHELEELPMVELPEEASEDAFGKVNQVLNSIADMSTTGTRIATQVKHVVGGLRKRRNLLRAKYDIKRADLMANNEAVKAEKNAEARAASAECKLKEERIAMEKADVDLHEVETLYDATVHVLSHAKLLKEICGHKLNITQKEMDLGLLNHRGGNDE